MSINKIIKLADKELISNSFGAFYRKSFGTVHPTTDYHHNWHIDYLSEVAQDCVKFILNDVIINIPPGLSKSTMFSQAFVAHNLSIDAGLYNLCVSNTESLAIEHSIKTRKIMESDWYKEYFPNSAIAKDQNQKTKFDTIAGGTRQATTSRSGATGKGAHFLIVDDFLNSETAKSTMIREQLVGGIGENFFTRMRDTVVGGKRCRIIIEQRLHDMDLTGKLLEESGWTHIKLPAYWEEPKIISFGKFTKEITQADLDEDGRYYLEPVRMGKEFIETKMTELKSAFSGQFLQDPVMKGGNMVHLSWFNRFFLETPPKFKSIIVSCDTAYTSNELNDPSCFIAIGITDAEQYYVLDVFNKHLGFPALKANLVSFLEKWKPHKVLIENKATGLSLIDEFKATKWSIMAIEPKSYGGHKDIRFENSTGVIEAGKVFLPERATWLQEFEQQLIRYPKTPHNDMCDSMSQALNYLRTRKTRLFWGGKKS